MKKAMESQKREMCKCSESIFSQLGLIIGELEKKLKDNSTEEAEHSGTTLGIVQNANLTYGMDKFNTPRGHGFAAERANHLNDGVKGMAVKMREIVVRTKEELENAVDRKYDRIIVVGELAEKVENLEQFKNVSFTTLKVAAAAVTAATVAMPFTGGLSIAIGTAALAPYVLATGIPAIAWIMLFAAIGIVLILAILEGYDITVEYGKNGEIRVCLTRKKETE